MTLEAFTDLISTLEIPAVYGAYHDPAAVPYISYLAVERNVIHADGVVVYGEDWIELRLVTRYRDRTLEQTLENLLTENGIAFGYPDYELNEEQRFHAVYYSFMLDPFSEDRIPHISLTERSAEVEAGKTTQLHIKSIYPADASITWISSDSSIATVSDAGIVTGVATGECFVIALIVSDENTLTDACTAFVYEEEED